MTTLEIICLYGLGISLCLLLFDAAGKTLRAAWRRNGRRYGVAASLIGLAVVCTINAQKPNPPVITVDAFLRDAGCYATNDVLHVAVTNAPAYAGIDFSSCPVLVYARPRGLSDAPEWEELLPRRTFSELPADYAIEDATNYNYLVYLDYIPPSPVHTNGVFELRGFVVPGDEPGNLEQLAAGFINSRAILPPPTARDYVQDGLVALWDGIENAGWGVHDASATTWKDLIGSFDAVKVGSPTWSDNAANTSGIANTFQATIPTSSDFINAAKSGPISIEICLSISSIWGSRCPFSIEDSNGSSSVYRFVQIFMQASKMYLPAPYEKNGTAFIGTGPVFDNPSGTISVSFGADGEYLSATPSRNGVVGTKGSLKIGTNAIFDPATLGELGVSTWYVRIGRTHNNYLPAAYHCVRVYSRALSAEEIAHNYEIDKERFNLP